MANTSCKVCSPVEISDDDVFTAMREISGYIDITPSDFKELYIKAYRQALSRLTRSLKVKEVMTTQIISARPEFSLGEVAELMAANHISGLPVVDDDNKPLGVISERDFLKVMMGRKTASLMEIIAQCLGGKTCLMAPVGIQRAKNIMTSPAVIVGTDDEVDDVSRLFASKRINRAPVVNAEGSMVGIVSRGDLMRSFECGGSE
ncbi:MAG: CBS domain-containing protein [Pseudomonadota bacterium]